jgi:hypothetical protein
LGAIDFAHPAFANGRKDLVRAEFVAERKRHRCYAILSQQATHNLRRLKGAYRRIGIQVGRAAALLRYPDFTNAYRKASERSIF